MQDVGEGEGRPEKVTLNLTFDTEPSIYLRKAFHAKGRVSAKGLRQNMPGKFPK